jgi:hypothetical protein
MDDQRVELLVDQATGVLMARHQCTASEATVMLQVEAESRHLPPASVAAEIVAGLDRTVNPDDTAGHVVPYAQLDDGSSDATT